MANQEGWLPDLVAMRIASHGIEDLPRRALWDFATGFTVVDDPAGGRKVLSVEQFASFDVRRFGAIGDGVANDTVAIQAAIDAAEAAGGGIIQLSHNHRVTEDFDAITTNNVIIRGLGAGFNAGTQIYIDKPGTTANPFTFSCQHGGIEDVYFRAGRIYTAECYAVTFNGAFRCHAFNIRVDHHWGAVCNVDSTETRLSEVNTRALLGSVGVKHAGTVGNGSYRCVFDTGVMDQPYPLPHPTTAVGIGAWAPSTDYALKDIRTNAGLVWQCSKAGSSAGSGGPSAIPGSDPGAAFVTAVADGSAEWKFVCRADLTHILMDSYGYTLDLRGIAWINGVFPLVMRDAANTGSSEPHFLFVEGCETDHNLGALILNKGAEIRFANCSFGATLGDHGVRIDADCSLDILFQNVKVFGCQKDGFNIGANGVMLHSCATGNNGQGTSNTYDGIRIGSNVSGFSVQGHKSLNSSGQQRRGLTLDNGTSDNYTLANNEFTGNLTGGFYDGGAGANKRVHGNRPDPLRVRLSAQTGNIGATNLFPVNPGAGEYEVDVYLEVTAAGTLGSLVVTIAYTDAVGATSQATSGHDITGTGRKSARFTVRTSGSANITYAVSGITTPGSLSYNLSVVPRGPL